MCENSAKSKKLYLTGGNLKEDTLLRHGEISVSESEKRANGSLNLREYYTVYLIETNYDKHFIEFLQNEDGWREMFKSNGYLQIAENKLKALSVSVRLKNTDPRFESIKTYGNTLHTSIYNLLKARSRVAEKQYTVYKLHANYGRVFSEWSAIEKEMGDALQKTGHYLDSLSSSIDSLLEDEELLVDQFKEYLFFASSLQNLCKHQELLQLKLESAEDNITVKNSERVKAQQGKMGIMSRLFGTIDTDEVRELKVTLLDQQIQDGEVVVSDTKTELM
ncbi:sorting nexin-4 [Holotrichia oblita]|uniref:Sorting nexin-4 n=1 Tax=Holotrichia oblita TaxID=644536 RepID=A0ACB9SZQ8_HOLOL|nr:sorting nexin-4 [Holotrichia oblita]